MDQQPLDTEDEDTSDEEDEVKEDYLKKFDREVMANYVDVYHPESRMHNYDEEEVYQLLKRSQEIIDDLHRTLPFMTKFEKARILGIRAKQLNEGAQPFVKVPPNIVTVYTIAQMELENKRFHLSFDVLFQEEEVNIGKLPILNL